MELAAKLDAELDEYISSLERKSYTEGWREDEWQAEMEKHPFFMKKAPEPGDELSPLMEGLQQLKYGEDENTPEGTYVRTYLLKIALRYCQLLAREFLRTFRYKIF